MQWLLGVKKKCFKMLYFIKVHRTKRCLQYVLIFTQIESFWLPSQFAWIDHVHTLLLQSVLSRFRSMDEKPCPDRDVPDRLPPGGRFAYGHTSNLPLYLSVQWMSPQTNTSPHPQLRHAFLSNWRRCSSPVTAISLDSHQTQDISLWQSVSVWDELSDKSRGLSGGIIHAIRSEPAELV